MRQVVFYLNYFKEFIKSIISRNNRFESSNYQRVGILNPSVGSANLGDQIIYESVYKILRKEVFSKDFILSFPTQYFASHDLNRELNKQDKLIVSGTNLLSSNMEKKHQWKLKPFQSNYFKNKVILMGCGWWQYQKGINSYTSKLYRNVLSKDYIHSVRDSYTEKKLKNLGLKVLNTSCPTLWSLNKKYCSQIAKNKSKNVVTTLTSYNEDRINDQKMLDILSSNYESVYIWLQSIDDFFYVKKLKLSQNIKVLDPTIESYYTILRDKDIEYVGTRLHAGIKAVQMGRRTLILAVDNRAIEIGKDIGLNVHRREDINEINKFLKEEYITKIKLPEENIRIWKNQFYEK